MLRCLIHKWLSPSDRGGSMVQEVQKGQGHRGEQEEDEDHLSVEG